MTQSAEQKRAYMAQWRAANKARIYEYNKAFVEANRQEHDAKRAAYREANREQINSYAKSYYEQNRDERLQYAAAYRSTNGAKHAAASAKWRSENPEKQQAAVNAWRKANPTADTVHRQKRRARKAQVGGKLSPRIVESLMDKQGGRCVYCAADLSVTGKHLDHKTPLSRGGSNTDDNVQLTCPRCNLKKHKKTDQEYREAMCSP